MRTEALRLCIAATISSSVRSGCRAINVNKSAACASSGEMLPPLGLGAMLPVACRRCIHLIAELGLTSNQSAASRRDAPDSTASTTRSRNSASASIRPPKPESMPARFNYPSLPGNPDSTQPKSALGIPVLYLLRHGDEVGVLFSAAEPTRPINRMDAPGRIVCAWCGRSSRPGTRCSFKECRAQLRCPGCSQYVQIPSEELLDEREVYECECGKAFGIDGVMEGVAERLPTAQLQVNHVFETKPTPKAFQ